MDKIDEYTYVDSVLQNTEPMQSDQAQIVMSMAYDVTYGIHDHLDPSQYNPLACVAMHEKEQYKEHSGLYRAIERYEYQEIQSRFGLSLDEYLALPRSVVDMLTQITIKIAKKMEEAEENAQEEAHNEHHRRKGKRV